MLDPKSRLQMLKNLDIPLWEKRNPVLFLDRPLAFARLAVILAQPLKPKDAEEKKVLMGMLNVLGLRREEYWFGWLIKWGSENAWSKTKFQDLFWQNLRAWKPEALLLLGQDLVEKLGFQSLQTTEKEGSDNLHDNPNQDGLLPKIHTTFHPEELIKMPEKKKKTYQSLLNLKQTLMSV